VHSPKQLSAFEATVLRRLSANALAVQAPRQQQGAAAGDVGHLQQQLPQQQELGRSVCEYTSQQQQQQPGASVTAAGAVGTSAWENANSVSSNSSSRSSALVVPGENKVDLMFDQDWLPAHNMQSSIATPFSPCVPCGVAA
jgi:hypothetical protein